MKNNRPYAYHLVENSQISIQQNNSNRCRPFSQMISRWKILTIGAGFLFIFYKIFNESSDLVQRQPKVLLISFDGFRYDLLNKTMVPNIYHWAQRSTWFVNGSRSQFMTMTAPNHLSIVTGLYEENHGVTGNIFYVDKEKIIDYYGTKEAQDRSHDLLKSPILQGDPIWLTNERAGSGRRSSVYFWPFCEAYFPFSPHQPKFCSPWKEYGTKATWMVEVDNIADELSREENPTNFIAWYVDQPDAVLHKKGFFTGDFAKVLKDLDFLWNYLLAKFEEKGLMDKVNIILTADHGHAEVIDYKHVLCIKDFVHGDFKAGDLKIYPENEKHEEEIYKNLTEGVKKLGLKIKIHRAKDFPEKYHFINNPRSGGIIIEPEIGYTATFKCTSQGQEKLFGPVGKAFHSSTHGHNPDHNEMRAFLVMSGPDIKNSEKIDDIPENIDLYPLMCHLLRIPCSPNNGTLNVVGKALNSRGKYRNM